LGKVDTLVTGAIGSLPGVGGARGPKSECKLEALDFEVCDEVATEKTEEVGEDVAEEEETDAS
jgi:hypothetical protein